MELVCTCPLIDEWIKEMWYACTMEFYSVIKKNGNYVVCWKMDGTQDHHGK
jgi:hypothetical protein